MTGGEGFEVTTSLDKVKAQTVIWAAGVRDR